MARWDADPAPSCRAGTRATGPIVNVASINALGAHPNKPADVAAKRGLLVTADMPTSL